MRKNTATALPDAKSSRSKAFKGALASAAVVALQLGAAQAQALVPPAYVSGSQFLTLGASAAMAFETRSEGSALERIMRQQNGLAAPLAPSPAAAGFMLASYTPPARTFSYPLLQPAVLRSSPRTAAPGPNPDVFGSVALAVPGSALDARWRSVANSAPPASARWIQAVHAMAALPERERLTRVNSWVNGAIKFEDDARLYGERDHWASARESLARGRGDCEDYAIAKMQMLRAAGVPAANLYLVIARDLVRRADHAVLAVRMDDGFWILDSGGDQVTAAADVRDYRPVVTYSAGHTWVHGFQRAPDVMLASNEGLAPASAR
jgi:predicted transglutaminase-like cysteine proteinase